MLDGRFPMYVVKDGKLHSVRIASECDKCKKQSELTMWSDGLHCECGAKTAPCPVQIKLVLNALGAKA